MTDPQESTPHSAEAGRARLASRPRNGVELWHAIAGKIGADRAGRYAGHVMLLVVAGIGLWAGRVGLRALPGGPGLTFIAGEVRAEPAPAAAAELGVEDLPVYAGGRGGGVARRLEMHTTVPSRPRLDLIKYVVQQGDTVFGVAENFGLKPETILWGNYDVLQDNPHNLQPGQELTILPVDGALYEWNVGDGLTGVAKFFGVTPQDIIDWPGNGIDPMADAANPGIEAGTELVIPGGRRELQVIWTARITRADPARARLLGAGACGTVYDGPIGTGAFIWPTPLHYLSGWGFSSIHPGIDIAGDTGHAIYASDSGVIVFAGWNNGGYGNVIVIDHGNGWQTLYAHLSQINMACGQAVFPGNVIGLMGCTGNCSGSHLHFEMMNDEFGKVNPLNFLP